jgi:hypothetical protein
MRPGVQASEVQVVAALDLRAARAPSLSLTREAFACLRHKVGRSRLSNRNWSGGWPRSRSRSTAVSTSGESVERLVQLLLAEVGNDLSRFPDAEHLSRLCGRLSWAEGERRPTTERAQSSRAIAMCVPPWSKPPMACGARTPRLRERYRRLKKRRGSKRAALAVGHSILVIYYHLMTTGQEYQEKGAEFFQRTDRAKVERQLIERLERLGYHVTRPQLAA